MIAITTIVVFIFICNKFIRYLNYVASGKYAANMLFYITMLQLPYLFGMLLPLGLFLSILLGYGRLYADSEMTVLSACGFSKQQLITTTMKIASLIALAVIILVIWAGPKIAKQRNLIVMIAESSSIFQTIMPNYFQTSPKGNNVFYVQKMSTDHSQMQNLFIAQRARDKSKKSTKKNWTIITAARGHQMTDNQTGDQYMVALNGYRYQGIPGEKNYQITKYDKYGIRLNTPSNLTHQTREETISTYKLLKNADKNPNYMAELQWRFSFPISALILALLAIPLSQVNPRRGRFAQLIPAILIYIFYANMVFISRNWLKTELVPSWIGIWWVHALMLSLALFLLNRKNIVKRKK